MTITIIDQKIVGFSISGDDAEAEAKVEAETETKVEQMHENLQRPECLHGSSYKIKTPLSEHALYITINDIKLNPGTEHERMQPFEIFINSKNLEHFQWVVALTRVISAVFRKGGDITFLVEELKAVFDPTGGYFKSGGRFMPSLVAEIGEVIETHLRNIGLLEEEEMPAYQREILQQKQEEYQRRNDSSNAPDNTASNDEESSFPSSANVCFKCHNKAVIIMDGCKTCLNCGDSKCG